MIVVHYSAETTHEETVVQQAFELVVILRFVMEYLFLQTVFL